MFKEDRMQQDKRNIALQRMIAIINILLPLIAGALVYIIWVPSAHVSQVFYRVFGLHSLPGDGTAGSFITCFLGDFLWAYSLVVLLVMIIAHRKRDIIFVLALCILFETGTECLQLTPLMDGTFDFLDIVIEILANLLGCLMICLYEGLWRQRKKAPEHIERRTTQ